MQSIRSRFASAAALTAPTVAALVTGLAASNWVLGVAGDPRPGQRLQYLALWLAGAAAMTALTWVSVRFRVGPICVLVAALGLYRPITFYATAVAFFLSCALPINLYGDRDWRRPCRSGFAFALAGWLIGQALMLAVVAWDRYKGNFWLVPLPLAAGAIALGRFGFERRRVEKAALSAAPSALPSRVQGHPVIPLAFGLLCGLLMFALDLAIVLHVADYHSMLRPTIDY